MKFTWHLVVEPFDLRTSSLETEPEVENLMQVICGGNVPGVEEWGLGERQGRAGQGGKADWECSLSQSPASSWPPGSPGANLHYRVVTSRWKGQPFVFFQLVIGWRQLSGVVSSSMLTAILWMRGQLWVIGSQSSQQLGDGCTRPDKGNLERELIAFFKQILPGSLIDVKEHTHTHTAGKWTYLCLCPLGTFTENLYSLSPSEEEKVHQSVETYRGKH